MEQQKDEKIIFCKGGGCTAKLGMNGKDHVKKGLPALEDMIGGFAVVISQNDGVNPEIDLSILGRHTVGTGSAPQAVIGSLVAEPLARAGLKITDIDMENKKVSLSIRALLEEPEAEEDAPAEE